MNKTSHSIFVTGGCKNGKSTYALHQAMALAGSGPRYYIATLLPRDAEQQACVRRHQQARQGMDFLTVECPTNLPPCPPNADPNGVFLLDSVTALLDNEMFDPDGTMDPTAPDRVIAALDAFLNTVRHAVIVSDYIYGDGRDYGPTTQAYQKALSRVDCFLAQKCDQVAEICAGFATLHKRI